MKKFAPAYTPFTLARMALEPKPKKVQIPVSLDPHALVRLQRIMEARPGVTRNDTVRYILEKGLPLVEAELGITGVTQSGTRAPKGR